MTCILVWITIVSIYYDLILDEKVTGIGKEMNGMLWSPMCDKLQNLVHGFWEDSKALVYLGSRKSPTGWGKGSMKRIVDCRNRGD